ncbi:hypothetical protein ACJX0J_011750 [Zea mays]
MALGIKMGQIFFEVCLVPFVNFTTDSLFWHFGNATFGEILLSSLLTEMGGLELAMALLLIAFCKDILFLFSELSYWNEIGEDLFTCVGLEGLCQEAEMAAMRQIMIPECIPVFYKTARCTLLRILQEEENPAFAEGFPA